MYGEITYNDSKSINIKAIPFRFHFYSQKVILCFNCSEICSNRLRAISTFAPVSCPVLQKIKKIKFVQLSTGK